MPPYWPSWDHDGSENTLLTWTSHFAIRIAFQKSIFQSAQFRIFLLLEPRSFIRLFIVITSLFFRRSNIRKSSTLNLAAIRRNSSWTQPHFSAKIVLKEVNRDKLWDVDGTQLQQMLCVVLVDHSGQNCMQRSNASILAWRICYTHLSLIIRMIKLSCRCKIFLSDIIIRYLMADSFWKLVWHQEFYYGCPSIRTVFPVSIPNNNEWKTEIIDTWHLAKHESSWVEMRVRWGVLISNYRIFRASFLFPSTSMMYLRRSLTTADCEKIFHVKL